jgi:hypothetical protein
MSSRPTPTLTNLIAEKIPLFAMSGALSLVTFLGYHSSGVLPTLGERPLVFRLSNALVSYAAYLQKMVWPTDLCITYPISGDRHAWQVLLSGLVVGGITGLALRARHERPYLTVGWFWYLGTLVPVIGLIQHGVQSMADHYTYLPLIGVYLAMVWLAADLAKRHATLRWAFTAPAVAAVLLLASLSWVQVGYWKDSLTLFRHTLAVTSNNAAAHHQLGIALGESGDFVAAQSQFEHALRINPLYALAHRNLAVALAMQQRWQDAAPHFAEAARLNPGDAQAQLGLRTAMARLEGTSVTDLAPVAVSQVVGAPE